MCVYAHSGRRLTPQGQRDLDRIAGQVGGFVLEPDTQRTHTR